METIAKENRPRYPTVALLFSLFGPGLGQIYCGQLGKASVMFLLATVSGTLALFNLLPVTSWFRTITLSAVGLFFVVWIWSCVDGRRTAKRLGTAYILKDYNRWYFYIILVLPTIPASFSLAFFVRDNFMPAFKMVGESMEPTIHHGEKVLANKTAYRQDPIQRGDIVAVINPNKRNQKNIKRLIALPGDKVAIKDGMAYVNNQPVPGTRPHTQPAAPGHELHETTIANGHCFVLGDNRAIFYDSRSYGQVPLADIIGRVDYIYYPRWVNLKPKTK